MNKEKTDLKRVATEKLTRELMTREGVRLVTADPHVGISVTVNGPALVLIVTD